MDRIRNFALVSLFTAILLVTANGCSAAKSTVPSATPEPTETLTPTITLTPTPTQTTTPANTITPRPSFTPTVTLTPFNTLSPTPTASPVSSQPAVLFPYEDINGKTIDWSYIHVTQIGYNRLNEVNELWAFMGFQLLDRAIYHRNLEFLGETITVYYLNVAHEFDDEMVTMQLVLGGTPGKDVAIADIPAGGTAYVQVQVRESSEDFAPYVTHRDANRAFEYRDESYPLMFLKELQTLLPTLPDEIILLADHPILIPQDDWSQIKLDMARVSYLAARYHPLFEIDDYNRLVDQSDFAYALRDHILNGWDMPAGFYAFSSQTLIIIVNGE